MHDEHLSWLEINAVALRHNVKAFRRLLGEACELLVVVKANAYGHGLLQVAPLVVEAGATWLAVFDVHEAFALRAANIQVPILVLGPTPPALLEQAAQQEVRLTLASPHAAEVLLSTSTRPVHVHLKLETGTHRQGFLPDELPKLKALHEAAGIDVEGAYTHYADIEDTTDHRYAMEQLELFKRALVLLEQQGLRPRLAHSACSAAALLFDDTHFNMARIGISSYGLYSSKETLVSVRQSGREPMPLQPVMTWKTRIAQVKRIEANQSIGYGRSYKTTRVTDLAVLPVGYANGYDRGLSNKAHVLVRGQRAKVLGRVMMNMIVVDVTDIAGSTAGDEVVLLGLQGNENISAELMASWLDTINYEVVTRIEPFGPRFVVDK